MTAQTDRERKIFLLAGLLWFAGLSCAAEPIIEHERHLEQEEARRLMQAGTIRPLQEILESIQGPHPGKVVEVELEMEQGRYIYEIEILEADGCVSEIKIDAADGTILKSK